MASVYWPRPVMKPLSSVRRSEAPIVDALMVSSRYPFLASAHCLCAGGNRLHDIVVAGAAAEIAFQLLADRVFVEIVALAVHDIDRAHDHARRAEPAPQSVMA